MGDLKDELELEQFRKDMAILRDRDTVVIKPENFGPWSKNTLLHGVSSMGTTHVVDVLQFNEVGIEIRRQEEGCFHCRKLIGPLSLTWNQLQKLSEAKEDVNMGSVRIPKASFDWLLGLKEKVAETKTEIPKTKERAKI